MKTIVITNQQELDALPKSFAEYTIIEIRSAQRITVVVARENSSVEARENSSVVAWENSSVVARENSSVVAWGNSSVVARENSSVVARENCGVHVQSDLSVIEIFGFAVAWLVAKGAKAKKSSETATVVTPKRASGVGGWLSDEGVKPAGNLAIVFKRVSTDFKTQEKTVNETVWSLGATLTHPAWEPKSTECGEGKFHACSRPYFCDQFRSVRGDRYVAIQVAMDDLHAWENPEYPHKIAFRAGTVLHECDRMGRKVEVRP